MIGTSEQILKISKTGFAKIGHTAVSKPQWVGFSSKKTGCDNKVGKKNFFFHILAWAFFTRTTPISKKIIWVSKSFTVINEAILCLHKLHRNKWGNSVFAQNLLSYSQSKYWENVNYNCFTENYDEYKSKT